MFCNVAAFVLIGVLVGTVASEDQCKYPCGSGSKINQQCVRQFFKSHGSCSVVRRSDNKPVYRERFVCNIPKINLTVITVDTQITLNGPIEKFCIKDNKKLIMTVNLKDTFLKAFAYFNVSRIGDEPVVRADNADIRFPAILTSVIDLENGKISKSALNKALFSAYITESMVPFNIGPKVTESQDKHIQLMLAQLVQNIPTALQEIYLSESKSQFIGYIQKHICDFGLSLSVAP